MITSGKIKRSWSATAVLLCCAVHQSNRSPIEPFTNQVHTTLVEPFTNLEHWWLVRTIRQNNNKLWILHPKDHFSKASFFYALSDKTAAGVAKCVGEWIGMFGVPKIIQCDNGSEFKGVLLILLEKYGIKILNGRPRYPQTQGPVE